jgi:hypothetical protein
MPRRAVAFLFTLLCLAPLTLPAQQPTTSSPATAPAGAAPGAGPRRAPAFPRYEPTITRGNTAVATAAAADRTVITISTLGLVLLIVLLIVLLA